MSPTDISLIAMIIPLAGLWIYYSIYRRNGSILQIEFKHKPSGALLFFPSEVEHHWDYPLLIKITNAGNKSEIIKRIYITLKGGKEFNTGLEEFKIEGNASVEKKIENLTVEDFINSKKIVIEDGRKRKTKEKIAEEAKKNIKEILRKKARAGL